MKRTLPTTVLTLALLAGAAATAAPASAVGSTYPQCFRAQDCPRTYPTPRPHTTQLPTGAHARARITASR